MEKKERGGAREGSGRAKKEIKAEIAYNGLKFYTQEQKDDFLLKLKDLRKRTGKQNCELLIEALEFLNKKENN